MENILKIQIKVKISCKLYEVIVPKKKVGGDIFQYSRIVKTITP